jgi:hypothetical protein
MPLARFGGIPPALDASGDIESMDFLAGQSVGLVQEIKPAAEIVREVVEQAAMILREKWILFGSAIIPTGLPASWASIGRTTLQNAQNAIRCCVKRLLLPSIFTLSVFESCRGLLFADLWSTPAGILLPWLCFAARQK